MSITLYECPMGHVISNLPTLCAECGGSLLPIEYEPVKKNGHPIDRLHVDDDGYVFTTDPDPKGGPGVWWTLHHGGWEAYTNMEPFLSEGPPLMMVGGVEFPSEDDFATAYGRYEEWLERNPDAKKKTSSDS